MSRSSPIAVVTRLAIRTAGAFRGNAAVEQGVSRKQLATLLAHGAIERLFYDTFRLTGAARTHDQLLHAALLWAGDRAAGDGRSAGAVYGLEGVRTSVPAIVTPTGLRRSSEDVVVRSCDDRSALMIRQIRGLRVVGVEACLLTLAHELDDEALEIACEDARRRGLTSVPALRAYLDRYGKRGRPGVAALRQLLTQLDPQHASRSTLEVKTRRLLVAHGVTDFVRELPLDWNGRTYFFDFGFEVGRTILETNGRRWHDDPADYEHDHEKWSVPGRHGYKLVFATWDKVTRRPGELVAEVAATRRAAAPSSRAASFTPSR